MSNPNLMQFKIVGNEDYPRVFITCPHCKAEIDHWDTIQSGGYIENRSHFELDDPTDTMNSPLTLEIEELPCGQNGDWQFSHYCPMCQGDIEDVVMSFIDEEE